VGWLRSEPPAGAPEGSALPASATPPDRSDLEAAIELVLANPEALAEVVARACPEGGRRDGWTPFARRLFLQVIAETGRFSLALEYAGLSKASAYALRDRDRTFAAGWAAAAMLARNPLSDTVCEQSIDGITDTIVKNGEVVAERRRFDARQQMAVLNRLDKQCERAEALGLQTHVVMEHWNEWLELIGKGDEAGARALLESGDSKIPPNGQLGQLPESGNPTVEEDRELLGPVWKEEGIWWTDFPPPPGFDGFEEGRWDGYPYRRHCSADEAELLDAEEKAEDAELLAEGEQEREAWFGEVRRQLNESSGGRGDADPTCSGSTPDGRSPRSRE
jgi:hypothetical protein